MKNKSLLFSIFLLFVLRPCLFAQVTPADRKIDEQVSKAIQGNYLAVKAYFDKAYLAYPEIPKGMLEAVSFTMTRFYHVLATGEESCVGLPRVYGVMGLTLDGKNYFRNNLLKSLPGGSR